MRDAAARHVLIMSGPIARLNADLIGRYVIQSEARVGSMVTEYVGRDLEHDREVCIKVVKPELAEVVGVERFLSAIGPAASLRGTHILPLLDSGRVADTAYYVVPRVDGELLRERLDRGGRLSVDVTLGITRDVALALTHAHERGIVHCDLRPTHILLGSENALVADFGIGPAITAATRTHPTATGLYVGTPSYLSPEQIGENAPIDMRSDVHALGCMMYEMLTGDRPYPGTTVQVIVAKALSSWVPCIRAVQPDVPEGIEVAISTALARRPEERFGSVLELYEACVTSRSAG